MKVKVTEKNQNPLMDRQEIKFEAEHQNAPTPSRSEVLDSVSSELNVSKDLIVIEKLATPHGLHRAYGSARVYDSIDTLKEFESSHYLERTGISKEDLEEEEVSEEPQEPEVEEAEPEEEKEEIEEEKSEKPEEPEETVEKKEEPSEEDTEMEEIDYQELSDQNISEIKSKAEEIDLDYKKMLESEKANKDRKTLKSWLESKIEEEE